MMEGNRVLKHKHFLRQLFKNRQVKKRSKILQTAKRGEICAICEVIKNILHNPNLHLKPSVRQINKLKRSRQIIDQILNREVPFERKRKILQSGRGGFLIPLVISLIGPLLSKLIR
jgi:hypothetical protein